MVLQNHLCFHTSKEVLNPDILLRLTETPSSFHTSKEVLNLGRIAETLAQMPSFHTSKEVLNLSWEWRKKDDSKEFPYLKGSFKSRIRERMSLTYSGFHTSKEVLNRELPSVPCCWA